MPKYMTQFCYATPAVKAMVDKPQNRQPAAEKLFSAAGGKMECMYYCFGEFDGVVIVDFPSDTAAASAMLTVGASGVFSRLQTTHLMTMDTAVAAMEGAKKITGSYTPPTG